MLLVRYPKTKNYIEENLRKVCEEECLTVVEVIYFTA